MPRQPRKRRPGKKVRQLVQDTGQNIDPAKQRALAIEYALDFLVSAIVQERLWAAADDDHELPERATEHVLALDLQQLPTIDELRATSPTGLQKLSSVLTLQSLREPGRVDEVIAKVLSEVTARVRGAAEAWERAIPSDWRAEHELVTFEGAYRAEKEWQRLDFTLPPVTPKDPNEHLLSAKERKRKREAEEACAAAHLSPELDKRVAHDELRAALKERDAFLNAIRQDEPALAGELVPQLLAGKSAAISDPRWRTIEARIQKAQEAVGRMNPRGQHNAVHSSETRVREALASKLQISKGTVLARLKKAGLLRRDRLKP